MLKTKRNRRLMRYLIALAAASVLALTGGLLGLIRVSLCTEQTSQYAARRWGGELRYAQITAFLGTNSGKDMLAMRQAEMAMDAALESASLKVTSDNASARLWIYAYSAENSVTLRSSRSSSDANVTAVGGDFFYFHPMELLSGSLFNSDTPSVDLVVLDDRAAWQLFGSNDVAGMPLTAGDATYIVSGVVKSLDAEAYGSKARVYMSYETAARNQIVGDISVYEALLPNPISGFAQEKLQSALNAGGAVYKENSYRYTVFGLFDTLKAMFNASSPEITPCPYWENLASAAELRAALLIVPEVILYGLAVAIVLLSLLIFILTHPLKKEMFTNLMDNLREQTLLREKRRSNRRAARQMKKTAALKEDDTVLDSQRGGTGNIT